MSKRRRNRELDAYRAPSPIALRALQHPGAGRHQESQQERNRRTGRLRGAEKKRVMNDHE